MRRVLPYLKLARDRDAITTEDAGTVESVVGRLRDLVPEEPPSRLHGDLWNGNCLWSADAVHVIDPAAYGGHREVDIAMMLLFGGFGEECLAAYDAEHPLAPGWQERVPWYQLPPLLVHAVRFGGGYGDAAVRALRQLRG